MKVKMSGLGKMFLIPVAAIVLAGGSAAVVASHGQSGTHRSDEGKAHAKDATAPNNDLKPSPSPDASEAPESEDNSVARFHGDATSCPMPEGTTLDGNWTHGDYVSAWAKTGDHDKTLVAARSDCGKPQTSVDHSSAAPNEEANEDHGKPETEDASEHATEPEDAPASDNADGHASDRGDNRSEQGAAHGND